jgi:opacity protein-like surface antigen
MVLKRSHLVRAVVVCLLGVFAPWAAGATPSNGFYVGGGLGQANYDIDYSQQVNAAYSASPFTVVYANMTRSQDLAGKAYAGYQFANPFALELGYVNLGEPQAQFAVSSTSAGTTNPFTRNATYHIQGLNLAAVGRLLLDDQWSLHASVGAFYSQYKYSEFGNQSTGDPYSFTAPNLWQTNLSYGLGVSAQLSNQWVVRADWDRYQHVGNTFSFSTTGNGRFTDIDLLSLNLEYRFQ